MTPWAGFLNLWPLFQLTLSKCNENIHCCYFVIEIYRLAKISNLCVAIWLHELHEFLSFLKTSREFWKHYNISYYEQNCPIIRDHSFSTFAKFSEKLSFLAPWYAHVLGNGRREGGGGWRGSKRFQFFEKFAYVLNKWFLICLLAYFKLCSLFP